MILREYSLLLDRIEERLSVRAHRTVLAARRLTHLVEHSCQRPTRRHPVDLVRTMDLPKYLKSTINCPYKSEGTLYPYLSSMEV